MKSTPAKAGSGKQERLAAPELTKEAARRLEQRGIELRETFEEEMESVFTLTEAELLFVMK